MSIRCREHGSICDAISLGNKWGFFGVAGPLSPHSLFTSLLLYFYMLCRVNHSQVLQRQKEIFRSHLLKWIKMHRRGTLWQQLKWKPVTQVSLKQMKNESSPVQHPPSSEAGTQHASNIICLTRDAAQLLSLNNETWVASIRFRKGQHHFATGVKCCFHNEYAPDYPQAQHSLYSHSTEMISTYLH